MVNFAFSLNNFEYFLLILVRIVSFVFVARFFGDSAEPRRVKVGLSLFVAIFMYNIVNKPDLEYTSAVGYSVIVVREVMTGLLIGFAAYICNSIILFAGNIIDMDMGFSMAMEFNPSLNTQSTITGNFYYYLVMLILVASDMHSFILRAVCDSFTVVPIGKAVFDWDHLVLSITKYMGDMFVIGFRIFLPFFACIMILNCVLGIMAKVAPQMNMFSVGMQLKLLVGFAVLFLTIFLVPTVANFIFNEIKTMVVLIIEGLY